MVKRNNYPDHASGIFRKLKIQQLAREDQFKIQPLFLIYLDNFLWEWIQFVVHDKKTQGKKLTLDYRDIGIYADELSEIMTETPKALKDK